MCLGIITLSDWVRLPCMFGYNYLACLGIINMFFVCAVALCQLFFSHAGMTKVRIKCLAQEHNALSLLSFETLLFNLESNTLTLIALCI